ncbi:MAG: hypothetical protein ACRYGK_16435 [Janthinobacterium lividum]
MPLIEVRPASHSLTPLPSLPPAHGVHSLPGVLPLPGDCWEKIATLLTEPVVVDCRPWHHPRLLHRARALARFSLIGKPHHQAAMAVTQREPLGGDRCEALFYELARRIGSSALSVEEIETYSQRIASDFQTVRVNFRQSGPAQMKHLQRLLKHQALPILRGIFRAERWSHLELIYEENSERFYANNNRANAAANMANLEKDLPPYEDKVFLAQLQNSMAARQQPSTVNFALNVRHDNPNCDFFPPLASQTHFSAYALSTTCRAAQKLGALPVYLGMHVNGKSPLLHLDLGSEELSTISFHLILNALRAHSGLQTLNILKTPLSNFSVKWLDQQLEKNTLETLSFWVTWPNSADIVTSLKKNRSLRQVRVNISGDALGNLHLLDILFTNLQLRMLHVHLGQFQDAEGRHIASQLACNANLLGFGLTMKKDCVSILVTVIGGLQANRTLQHLDLQAGVTKTVVNSLCRLLTNRPVRLHLIIKKLKGTQEAIDYSKTTLDNLQLANALITVTIEEKR